MEKKSVWVAVDERGEGIARMSPEALVVELSANQKQRYFTIREAVVEIPDRPQQEPEQKEPEEAPMTWQQLAQKIQGSWLGEEQPEIVAVALADHYYGETSDAHRGVESLFIPTLANGDLPRAHWPANAHAIRQWQYLCDGERIGEADPNSFPPAALSEIREAWRVWLGKQSR